MSKIDPHYLAQALAEAAARENATSSLAGYTQYMLEFAPARHHRLICEKLDRVINGVIDPNYKGAIKRLIIAAPPGSAKSTYTSLGFAAYAAGKLPPRSNIIAASHTDEFSQTWGRRVRNLIQSEKQGRLFPNGVVSPDDRAASRWSTIGGTEYFGVGVGGSVTGRRANILLCDDLLRGRFDANSKKRRDEIFDWFTADAYSRLKNNGAIVIIATRWHEDDLTGRLLERMENGSGEQWEYLKLEALCENPLEDPMGRQYGEALWPEMQPREMMENIRDNSGTTAADWASLYQQSPSPEDGNMISRKWFNRFNLAESDEMLKECQIVVSNDTAVKGAERNDPTVTLAFARHKSGRIYLLREQRIREEFPKMKKKVKEFCESIEEEFGKITMLVENKGNGSALASSLKQEVSWPIIELEPKQLGDKEFRFDRCTPVFEGGQFHVPGDKEHSKWVDDYINELVTFPASKNDDRVDATSQALNWLADKKRRKRRQRDMHGLI